MKEIRINSISMNNWRGQTRVVEFEGGNAVISGKNHSGKSSVMNAFLWCITGFDSEDRSNYILFDDRLEQTHDNAVPAEVEVSLYVDGEDSVLKRVATQGWVRRRGTETYERDGSDKYTFFLNGIERSAGQFSQDIEYIFGAPKDKLKIMLNLAYFISLDWKMQRKHLGDIIGEVKESDFKEPARFDFIFNDLGRYSIEEIKERYKSLLRPMKESMQRLPIEIDTISQYLPSLDGVDEAKTEKAKCDAEIDRINRMISDRAAEAKQAMDIRLDAIKEIGADEEALEASRREYIKNIENDPRIIDATKRRNEASRHNNDIISQKTQDAADIRRMELRLKDLKDKKSWYEDRHLTLKDKLASVKDRTFSEDTCPYCHQTLPDSMLESAHAKFIEAQEEEKASVIKEGKSNKAQLEQVISEMTDLERQISELSSKSYNLADVSAYEAEISSLRASFPKYEETTEYLEKIAEIERKRANLPSIDNTDDTDLSIKMRALREKAEECVRIMTAEQRRKEQEKNISDKQAALKKTAEEMAKCEGKLNAISDYERERAEIIRTRVNGLFNYCEVCMETTDKSGNTVPACIIKDRSGVDFRVTNTASQIMCKIDISKAMQTFYQVSLPVFVDNCEAVNDDNMPVHFGQMIELRVSEAEFDVTKK